MSLTYARPDVLSPFRGLLRPRWPLALNRDSAQADGLTNCWPLQGEDLAAPVDLAGMNPGAADTSGIAWASDSEFTWAPSFDGSTYEKRVKLGLQSLSLTAGSLACWAKLDVGSSGTDLYALGRNLSGNNAGDIALILRSSSNRMSGFIQDGSNTSSVDVSAAPDLLWHHYLLAWDGTELALYVDGYSKVSTTGINLAAHGSTGLAVGAPNTTTTSDGSPWQGQVGDVRLYNRKLSDTEAALLYEARSRWELYQSAVSQVQLLYRGVLTFSDSMSGGGVGGSSAGARADYTSAGSGGAVGAGAAAPTLTVPSAGGAIGSGVAASSLLTLMQGGASAGGVAAVAAVYRPAPAGGAIGTGAGTISQGYHLTGSGGAVGSGTAQAVASVVMAGGAVGGGSASAARIAPTAIPDYPGRPDDGSGQRWRPAGVESGRLRPARN